MNSDSEKTIFFNALDIESPEKRAAYIQDACNGNDKLLRSVGALLRQNDLELNIVDRQLAAVASPTDIVDSPQEAANHQFSPGTMVGPYKLMEQIGEGGFGLVFVADQEKPVRRRVALKIIKPGMDSKELLARFEAERQALALMDHENIARVYDAGMTQTGQPYFVMELVRGIPLGEFCDSRKLNTQQRLELFQSICQAVQHAHQKGIIHRDLKPSNVLVTMQDGKAIPKVIDFGLVKAIAQSLTEKTIYTRFAAMMGTPAYMSPEQAEMSNVDVDTRSDIYSLGVILYELLTGSTPFTEDRLNLAGFDELRRIIKDEEPPRPSIRISTMANELISTVSTNRRIEASQLRSLMKGDLDWIVMKALDKDRNRRYATAAEFAQDVSRFLNDDPVSARPPTAFYRFTKFARRNRVSLTTAAIVVIALIAGTVVSVWQATVAYDAMEQARTAEADANSSRNELEDFTDRLKEANQLLATGRAFAKSGNMAEAHDAYTNATEVQPRYFYVWIERGSFYTRMGLWNRAAADYKKALDLGCAVDGAEFLGVPQLFHFVGDETTQQLIADELITSEKAKVETKLRGLLIGKLSHNDAAKILPDAENLVTSIHEKRRQMAWMPKGAKMYVSGWAHLKAGDPVRAIERLEKSADDRWPGNGIQYPLLAIAYYRAGRLDDAKQAIAKSDQLADQWHDQTVNQRQGSAPIPWFDWLEFLANHRDAMSLISGNEPFSDRRLDEAATLAEAAIQKP